MKKNNFFLILFLFLLFFGKEVFSSGHPKQFSYEPEIIEVSGKLKLIKKYGPPNYGESPKTDQKLYVLILKLNSPIQIKGDPNSEINKDSFEKVTEFQVICGQQNEKCHSLIDKAVLAKGTLSQAVSGHHFTSVILNINEIHEGY